MMRAVIGIVAVVVLAAAWYLGSPLFIDEPVNEEFSLRTAGGGLDMTRVMQMSSSERSAMQSEIMAIAAEASEHAVTEEMEVPAPVLVARGQFSDADSVHKGSGDALLYSLPDGQELLRIENFRTTNGPALVVYLTRHPSPASAADVTEGGFVSLGKLKGNVGNQNYPIPTGTSIDDYHSVVIWCELFGVLFSPAPLERI